MNRHRIGKDWRGSFKAGHSLQRKFVGRTEAEPLPTWGWPIARHGPDVPVISSYLPPGLAQNGPEYETDLAPEDRK